MKQTRILGKGGRLNAYLVEDASSIKLLTGGGEVLGIYIKAHGITVSAGGALIGYGNVLLTLTSLED